MHILKSSIALVLLLSACETLPMGGAQPLLTAAAPAPSIISAPSGSSQSLSAIETTPGRQPQPRSTAEVAFMKAQFNAIQARSIAENREYCGYLGLLPNGDFAISPPKRGQPAGCTPNNPPANMQVIASYHTHAAYAPRYDSEVPSATDLEGDISEGINGYVSTPGGRLWFTDGAAQSTTQICGVGCLTADPRFRPEQNNPVRQTYSLATLRQRQNN
ncbi:MAG: DUF4329 domain-containing protein [Rhodobacteraceae bacterium]|nr:DUF4329 domain-containing protein [Paracoccaceae bacterium]